MSQVSQAQAAATVRVVATVILCIGWGVAYLVWPDGITDTAIAAVTIGELLRAIAGGVIAICTLLFVGLLWADA